MSASTEKSLSRGTLWIRIAIGLVFLKFGVDKLGAGPERWEELGGAMELLGIGFLPAFWGFMAAFSEAVGGVCLARGILFRPFCILLGITMVVASIMTFDAGGFKQAAHAINMSIVFIGLLIAGPGRYALGSTVSFLRDSWYQ